MAISRRQFMAVSAALGGVVMAGRAAAGIGRVEGSCHSVSLLVSGLPADEGFVAGAAAAAEDLGLPAPVLLHWTAGLASDLRAAGAALKAMSDSRVVALVDEATAIALEEALREAGAAVLCRGTHVVDVGSGHHHMVAAPVAAGIGEALGAEFAPAILGHALVQLATGRYPRPLTTSASEMTATPGASWVSLVAQI